MIKKVSLGIAVAVLCVTLCFSVIFSFFSGISSLFLDENRYVEQVVNESYIASIEEILLDRLEADSLYYDIPFEYIINSVKTDQLKTLSEKYVYDLVVALKSGGEFPYITCDRSIMRAEIDRYLTDNPDIGMYYEEETIIELTEGFSATVDNTLNSFFDKSIVTNTARKLYSNNKLHFISNSFYWIIAIGGVSAVLILIIGFKNIRAAFYKVSASVWCGSVLLFIPVKILHSEDIISGLILEKGPFKTLIEGIYRILMDYSVKWSAIYLIISSVLLLASIILLIFIKEKKATEEANQTESNETVVNDEAC